MNQEKIIVWTDILATQMNHWMFFAMLTTAALMSGSPKPPVGLWILCAFMPVLFFFIRRYTNNFLIMASSHALCLALLFLVPVSHIVVRLFLCAYGAGCIIYSFVVRIRDEERLDESVAPPVAVGFIALFLFFLHYSGYTQADAYFMGMAAIYLICYYIRYYLLHYLHFLSVNLSSTAYIPRKEIFLSGARLTGAFTLLSAVLLALVSNARWLSWILGLIQKVITAIRESGFFALLASLLENDDYMPIRQTGGGGNMNQFLPLPEAGAPGAFWVILEKTMFILMPVLFLLLLCYALFRFILMLKEHFSRKRDYAKEGAPEEIVDIREKYEIQKKKKPQRNASIFLNPAEKIRRIYKQRIRAKQKKLESGKNAYPLNTYTARECGSLLSEEQLAYVYEKARYSNATCTKEDVKRAAGKA